MAARLREGKTFHLALPWVTMLAAILISTFTLIYITVPASVMHNNLFIWFTSPFNIYYEMINGSIFYNYIMVIILFLLVELYSRNLADIKGCVSLMDNAFLIGIAASYIASAIVWWFTGLPSAGTSIIAFNLLLFFVFETLDSELIVRMSCCNMKVKVIVSIFSFALVAIVLGSSTLVFFYIDGNAYRYLHLLGGAIFAIIYSMFLLMRPKVEYDERAVKQDVIKTGDEMYAEDVKMGKAVEKEAEKVEVKAEKVEGEVEEIEKDIEKEVKAKKARKRKLR